MPKLIDKSIDRFVVIDLQSCPIEEIVEKKFRYFLSVQKNITDVFMDFYKPIEQSLIEFCLEAFNANQSQTAEVLNINRNTLKKKIKEYNIDVRNLAPIDKPQSPFAERIYLADLETVDLLDLSRLKLGFLSLETDFISNKPKESFCRPVEKMLIQSSLEFFKGNHIQASHFLNINRNTLKKRVTDYSLRSVI